VESIPAHAHRAAFAEADRADVFILIGTTGEVAPANMIPRLARENGAKIIEINTEPSEYTDFVTHIFLQDKATKAMEQLMETIERF
jgi:NAD-dependent deacetylase